MSVFFRICSYVSNKDSCMNSYISGSALRPRYSGQQIEDGDNDDDDDNEDDDDDDDDNEDDDDADDTHE